MKNTCICCNSQEELPEGKCICYECENKQKVKATPTRVVVLNKALELACSKLSNSTKSFFDNSLFELQMLKQKFIEQAQKELEKN